MTGALNNDTFGEKAAMVLDMARSGRSKLLIAFLDIDGFKTATDQHGYDAGDFVLLEFTQGARYAAKP